MGGKEDEREKGRRVVGGGTMIRKKGVRGRGGGQ